MDQPLLTLHADVTDWLRERRPAWDIILRVDQLRATYADGRRQHFTFEADRLVRDQHGEAHRLLAAIDAGARLGLRVSP